MALIALSFAAGACSREAKGAPAKAIESAKEGVAKVGDAIVEAWDLALSDVSAKTEEIKARIEASKPEMKARLQDLKATFDEKLALARQRFSEAKEAAPQQLEALKKQANEALDAAKQAYEDVTSN